MKYYIKSIEQIITKDEQTGEQTLSEYCKMEKVNDKNTALSKYYEKLSNVAADLGKAHTYMTIGIESSVSDSIKSDTIGQYLEALPQPEPEPEPEQYVEITDPDAVAEDAVEYYVLINGAYIEDTGVQVGDRVYGKYVREPEA